MIDPRIITILPVPNSASRTWSVLVLNTDDALDLTDKLDALGLVAGRDYTYGYVHTPNEVLELIERERD